VLIWVIFAALTASVLYVLLRPLMTGSAEEGSRAAFDATVYRDQLKEVESDRERGLIGDADAEAARIEIARRLLAADVEEHAGGAATETKRPERLVPLGLAVILPLLVLGLYLLYGSPRLPDQPLVARLEDPSHSQDLQVLVANVEARLREHPEEGEGWEVIAPVYMSWRRYADAAEAFRQAARLLGESPKRLAGYGQALVLANNGVVTEDARKALERALVLDPKLIEPRLLLTIAKEQDGQFAAAAEGWRAMLADAPQDAPWRKLVEERLAQDEAKLAGKPVPGEGGEVASGPAQGERGPTEGDVAAAQTMTSADRQKMIETMVQRLADRLAQNSDDLPGWLKLVRAYSVLDRKDEAVKALARAKTAFSGNAEAIQQLDALATELGLKS
jgi:cytochrome c-type biogenesis protein CcmH